MKQDNNWNTSTEMPEEYNNRMEIELLKRDLNVITKLCEKMDAAIDKLQQVASDLSRIISLQDQKIKIQEKINEEVEKALDTEKRDHSLDVKELHTKINTVNSDLTTRINQTESNILEELQKTKDDLSKKINTIETWRYMMIGGIALAVFVLGNLLSVDLSKIFH